jgi:thymidylate kinase
MIVELFGPPGAGKSTLARALVSKMQELGEEITLLSSSRPADGVSTGAASPRLSSGFGRLTAPVRRASKLAGVATAKELMDGTMQLLASLPPRRLWLAGARYRLYLAGLDRSWRTAQRGTAISIFDQGYMSALTSLAYLNGTHDAALLGRLIAVLPQADLLVVLDTPRDILRSRIADRLKRQSALERMLELDLDGNLGQADVVKQVVALLDASGKGFLSCHCLDATSMSEAVQAISSAIVVETGALGDRSRDASSLAREGGRAP